MLGSQKSIGGCFNRIHKTRMYMQVPGIMLQQGDKYTHTHRHGHRHIQTHRLIQIYTYVHVW